MSSPFSCWSPSSPPGPAPPCPYFTSYSHYYRHTHCTALARLQSTPGQVMRLTEALPPTPWSRHSGQESTVKLYYLLCHYPGKTIISSYEGTVKLRDVVEVEVAVLSSYRPRHISHVVPTVHGHLHLPARPAGEGALDVVIQTVPHHHTAFSLMRSLVLELGLTLHLSN